MSYPLIVEVLREFGLITDVQADTAQQAHFAAEREWDAKVREANVWWANLAKIAYYNETTWWQRNWSGSFALWARDWIRERRTSYV
jgi:hypothetical protein